MDEQISSSARGIKGAIRKFLKEADGATAIEYGLIAALIAMALFVGLRFYYHQLGAMFNHIEETTNNATSNIT